MANRRLGTPHKRDKVVSAERGELDCQSLPPNKGCQSKKGKSLVKEHFEGQLLATHSNNQNSVQNDEMCPSVDPITLTPPKESRNAFLLMSPIFAQPQTPLNPTESKLKMYYSPDFKQPEKNIFDDALNFDEANITFSQNEEMREEEDESESSREGEGEEDKEESVIEVEQSSSVEETPEQGNGVKVGSAILGPAAKSCSCKNTQCLKGYCDCYRVGAACSKDCKCTDCQNTERYRKEHFKGQTIAITVPLVGDPERKQHPKGCNCQKSKCRKKYCECFQAGIACGSKCKCEECENCHDKHKTTAKKERKMQEI